MRLRKLYICGLMIGCMFLTACGDSSANNGENQANQEQGESGEIVGTVTGIIESINDSTITLAVMNVTEGELPNGGMPQQMPEGEMSSGGMPQQMPEGEMPSGEMPPQQMPEGEMPNGEMPPQQMPEGEMPSGEFPQQMPEGEIPSGEMPSGEIPQGGMHGEDMMFGETNSVDINVTSSTIVKDASGNEISLDDLSEATMVFIQIDKDGNAIVVTVGGQFQNRQEKF